MIRVTTARSKGNKPSKGRTKIKISKKKMEGWNGKTWGNRYEVEVGKKVRQNRRKIKQGKPPPKK